MNLRVRDNRASAFSPKRPYSRFRTAEHVSKVPTNKTRLSIGVGMGPPIGVQKGL
jgi:hypothetical protein